MQAFRAFLVAILAVCLTASPALAAYTGTVTPISKGGTGSATKNFVDLTTNQSAAGNKTFTGDTTLGVTSITGLLTATATVTFNKTAEASAAESILVAKISDDSVGQINFRNASATDAQLVPVIRMDSASTSTGGWWQTRATTDSGSNPVAFYDVRTIAGAAIQNRVLYRWSNNGTTVLDALPLNSGANLALSWGTQGGAAPTLTTSRSIGSKIITYAAFSDGVRADYAIGMSGNTGSGHQWYGVPIANSNFTHRFYAGTTIVAAIRGDGLFEMTGSEIHKPRIATTTPVTVVQGTDYKIVTRLGTPGAVAVNLPSSPSTGITYIIQDGTGDAAANNITINPASGTINGAATYVINSNYGSVELEYDGTTWLARKTST